LVLEKTKSRQGIMKITIIHPAIGKIPGEKYIRAWQMEPLQVAQIAALMPKDVELLFWDDRMEKIPYDIPTDLMIISVETYTAKRAYQISAEYRNRNVKVIMGGFHPTLCPDEASDYADTIVVGEAENIWHEVISDFREGRLKKRYDGTVCDFRKDIIPDRTIYKGKKYLNITLLESGRGCKFNCEFCSIQSFFKRSHHFRKIKTIVNEINLLKENTKLFFFVDDNIISDHAFASRLFMALIPLNIKWVGQADITITQNPDLLDLMVKSGCQAILIGFETLRVDNLNMMKKNLLTETEKLEDAIRLIHKSGIRIYGTFLFGYDYDSEEDFERVLKFCIRNKLFMVGFNHVTPFPGTPLYNRLEKENKLRFAKWWLDDNYTYGQVPFKSNINYKLIEKECRRIRQEFYGIRSILYRMTSLTNIFPLFMFLVYLFINTLLRKDTIQRKGFPLGDSSYTGEILTLDS